MDPSPVLYDCAQTKAATTNYVKSLAKQLASKGIRVNGVAPGSGPTLAGPRARQFAGRMNTTECARC